MKKFDQNEPIHLTVHYMDTSFTKFSCEEYELTASVLCLRKDNGTIYVPACNIEYFEVDRGVSP